MAACGVDPATRGRRLDESLTVIRRLLAGEVVDHRGEHIDVEAVCLRPMPRPPVPIVVGGRAPAALRRAGRLGDGWLGVFVDPVRFASSVAAVSAAAGTAGRRDVSWQHGLLAWCGFGPSRDAARPALAGAMEDLYQMPFERFARYAPHGRPDDVAEALVPYVEAGASSVLLAAVASEPDAVVAGAARVRALLGQVSRQPA